MGKPAKERSCLHHRMSKRWFTEKVSHLHAWMKVTFSPPQTSKEDKEASREDNKELVSSDTCWPSILACINTSPNHPSRYKMPECLHQHDQQRNPYRRSRPRSRLEELLPHKERHWNAGVHGTRDLRREVRHASRYILLRYVLARDGNTADTLQWMHISSADLQEGTYTSSQPSMNFFDRSLKGFSHGRLSRYKTKDSNRSFSDVSRRHRADQVQRNSSTISSSIYQWRLRRISIQCSWMKTSYLQKSPVARRRRRMPLQCKG